MTDTVLGDIPKGVFAGMVATAAMSPLMSPGLARAAPGRARLEMFPPRRVVRQLERAIAGQDRVSPSVERWLTFVAHVGYGCAMGAAYGVIRDRLPHGSPGAAGVLFGLGVWGVGYAGWVPLLGVREGTVAGSPRSLPFPLAAHVMFGLALGWIHGRLSRGVRGDPSARTLQT